MRAAPVNGTVLCERIARDPAPFEAEPPPEYRVEAVSDGLSWPAPGDVVVCDSTGTELRLPGGVKYLFKAENVAGRVIG